MSGFISIYLSLSFNWKITIKTLQFNVRTVQKTKYHTRMPFSRLPPSAEGNRHRASMSHVAPAVGRNDSLSFLLMWREWKQASCRPHPVCEGSASPTATFPPLKLDHTTLLLKQECALTWTQVFQACTPSPLLSSLTSCTLCAGKDFFF